jgi:hypothetical protein
MSVITFWKWYLNVDNYWNLYCIFQFRLEYLIFPYSFWYINEKKLTLKIVVNFSAAFLKIT